MSPTQESFESAAVPGLPRSRPGASSKIGVALGSGASRGLAHIGVMRALQEQRLQVSFVAGTSMGAFIGSVFAAGNLQRLGTDFLVFDWRRVASLLDPVFPRSGLIDGQKLATFLSDYISHRRIEDLPVKFRAVATDLLTGAVGVEPSRPAPSGCASPTRVCRWRQHTCRACST